MDVCIIHPIYPVINLHITYILTIYPLDVYDELDI